MRNMLIRGRLLALLMLVSCTVPVVTAVDDSDANKIVVALDHAEIDSNKEVDPEADGKFRIVVARDDVARALGAMRDEALPRPKPAGVLDSMDKGALVPSVAAEHAQMVAGLAGDLERTLESVDGVLSARVHLNLPEQDLLREKAQEKATASVLVEHRGSASPLSTDAIQRLIAGGVHGVAPADVAVVLVARPSPIHQERALSHLGPIAVLQSSSRSLQVVLATLLVLIAALGSFTILLYTRLARLRARP